MNSPCYAPAGLLVARGPIRVMIDGGPAAAPRGRLDAWLVTDEKAELAVAIRRLATARGITPRLAAWSAPGLRITPHAVVHTSHPTYGYEIEAGRSRVVWAPEFLEFPAWAAAADLMFAEAAGWRRPIHFAAGAGGHAAALDVACEARERGIRRLVFAHIGRPTIRAAGRGEQPSFGELGRDGATYRLPPRRRVPVRRR
jgi:beta-lactamase family protein